ncbi:MAG: hypothetical protein M4D80_27015 [Myxococcota bacterium]|nr:hypothetical protein [Myxococcota bacterium]
MVMQLAHGQPRCDPTAPPEPLDPSDAGAAGATSDGLTAAVGETSGGLTVAGAAFGVAATLASGRGFVVTDGGPLQAQHRHAAATNIAWRAIVVIS